MLIVSSFLSTQGRSRNVCEDLAPRLRSSGWRVITTSDKVPRLARVMDSLKTIFDQRNEYAVAQVDIFSGLGFARAEAACLALQALHKPIVLTLHGGSLPEFASRWPRRVRRLMQAARAITAPSEFLATRLRQYAPNVHIIPNSIDTADFPFRLRQQLAPKFVWVRKFHRRYNPTLVPEILVLCLKRWPAATATMVGPDEDGSMRETQDRARELGVEGAMHFTGAVHRSELGRWLDSADVFLNTTGVDNQPVSVIEALSAGLCVVSTDVGGLRYLLADGDNALLVPTISARAFEQRLIELLETENLGTKLSERAHQYAQRFSWQTVGAAWDALLREAARPVDYERSSVAAGAGSRLS